jgi:hypothetical protein
MYGIKLGGENSAVRRYAVRYAEISWLLLVGIQNVSVSQDIVDVPFDENIYETYTRKVANFMQPSVEFCVWPALFQGSNILTKGIAEPTGDKRKPLDLQR